MSGLVYAIENTLNNKKYIGKTIISLERRMQQYLSKMKTYQNHRLYEDMRKYGIENFKTYILEEIENEKKLCDRERHWIKHYNATNLDFGYNSQSGGDKGFTNHPLSIEKEIETKKLRPFFVYDLEGNLIGEYKTQSSASRDTGVKRNRIGLFLTGYIGRDEQYIFIKKDEMCENLLEQRIKQTKQNVTRKILVFDIKTKGFVGEYSDVTFASVDTGISEPLIYGVLCHSRKSTYGYTFIYKNEYTKELLEEKTSGRKPRLKPFYVILSDKIVGIYDNQTKAAKDLHCSQSRISECLYNYPESTNSYKFIYCEEYDTLNNKEEYIESKKKR